MLCVAQLGLGASQCRRCPKAQLRLSRHHSGMNDDQAISMKDHPQRLVLHNEVHARPPEPMVAPLAISHLVMAVDIEGARQSREHLSELLRDHHQPQPAEQSNHLRIDLGAYRLRWELHTEFVSWTFVRDGADPMLNAPQPEAAIDVVPRQWLQSLPGQCLTRIHLWLVPGRANEAGGPQPGLLREDTLVASEIAQGQGDVRTDFQLHADGYGRIVVSAGSLSARRAGRIVQRLLEIETYRMAAMLGLPVARQAFGRLGAAERELAELAQAIRSATADDEAQLLDRLTRLAGEVESQYAATHSRFSASHAYFALVDRRIEEIRESRIDGLQTIGEFMQRRLSPARSTCEWAARRQEALSMRISRISSLLRTRVDIEQQQSSQALLETMNRRQGLQLKLQSTVEGLSVAAISYYIIGLVHYLAEGLESRGWLHEPRLAIAAGVPLVIGLVWWFIRRVHHRMLAP